MKNAIQGFGVMALCIITLTSARSSEALQSGGAPTLPDRPVKIAPIDPANPDLEVPVELRSGKLCADDLVRIAAERHGVDPKLIKSVVVVESGGDPEAISRKGAAGCMQLMPGTARGLGVKNRFDPWQNIAAGTKYLRDLLVRFNGDLVLALAGYNAGEGAVDEHGGVPPYEETRGFVRKVLALYKGSGDLKEFKVSSRRATAHRGQHGEEGSRHTSLVSRSRIDRDPAYRAHVEERQRIRAEITARKEARRALYPEHVAERQRIREANMARRAWSVQTYDPETGAAVYARN